MSVGSLEKLVKLTQFKCQQKRKSKKEKKQEKERREKTKLIRNKKLDNYRYPIDIKKIIRKKYEQFNIMPINQIIQI